MPQPIQDLLGSKKFLCTLLGIGIAMAALKFGASNEIVIAILAAFGILVGAQGAQDHGREAAQIHADAQKGRLIPVVVEAPNDDETGPHPKTEAS